MFAPSQVTAQIEGSKAFAKDFMLRHNIPTARYKTFSSDEYEAACEHARSVDYRVVIKASGLAAGKGVICAESKDEALEALRQMMLDKTFGASGDEVVVEEYLEGYEISILTFCDGKNFVSLPPAQDHRRIFDGDRGPNAGGMGCYAPVDMVGKDLLATIDQTVLEPTFRGLRKEGSWDAAVLDFVTHYGWPVHVSADPFVGCLFTGIMVTEAGPRVLEYNARFGDPETQTLLPLLDERTDLAQVMLACTNGDLPSANVGVHAGFSATIILASEGYPGSYKKGFPLDIGHIPNGMNALKH